MNDLDLSSLRSISSILKDRPSYIAHTARGVDILNETEIPYNVKTLVVLLLKTGNFHDILDINQEEYIQIKFKNFKMLRYRRVKTQTEGGGSYLLEVEEDLKEMKKFF